MLIKMKINILVVLFFLLFIYFVCKNISLNDLTLAEENEKSFIGMESCLKCHNTPKIIKEYRKSIHYNALNNTELPTEKQGCESCHGPGSKHVENRPDIIDFKKLAHQESSKICLTCHFNLNQKANWTFSKHNQSGDGCLTCHSIHNAKKFLLKEKIKEDNTSRLCLSCHKDEAHKFRLTSRHPLFEERIKCIDCHNQHGSDNRNSLIKESNDLCVSCHPNYKGPFIAEHQATDENYQNGCLNCHQAHGSPNRHLLTLTERGTCIQCHGDKIVEHNPGMNCLNCHPYIHGSTVDSAIPFGQP